VEVVCHIKQLLKGETALIRITRRIHDNFFRQVTSLTLIVFTHTLVYASRWLQRSIERHNTQNMHWDLFVCQSLTSNCCVLLPGQV